MFIINNFIEKDGSYFEKPREKKTREKTRDEAPSQSIRKKLLELTTPSNQFKIITKNIYTRTRSHKPPKKEKILTFTIGGQFKVQAKYRQGDILELELVE